jgi:hypothetical protein
MPRFSGEQYPGAMKDYRAMKRAEAEARNGQDRKADEPEEAVGS